MLVVEGDDAKEHPVDINIAQNVSNILYFNETRQKLLRSHLENGGQRRTRRQLAHLTVILCGAELIYDAHRPRDLLPDSEILFGEGSFPQALSSNGLHILNPYAIYGHPDILPRPSLVQTQEEARFEFRKFQRPKTSKAQRPLIQVGLGSVFPNGSVLQEGHGDLYGQPKGAGVMPGIFAMLPESPHMIVHNHAFWGLPLLHLPDTVCGWFTFQRLLWINHGQVLVSRPNFQLEAPKIANLSIPEFVERGADLLEVLLKWKEPEGTFGQQIADLLQNLVREKFIENEVVLDIESWLDDLRSLGYEFPRSVETSLQPVKRPTKVLAAFCFSGQMDRASKAIPETLRSLKVLLTGSNLIPEVNRLTQTVQHSMDVEGTVTFHSDVFAYLSTHNSCPADIKWMSASSFTYGIMYVPYTKNLNSCCQLLACGLFPSAEKFLLNMFPPTDTSICRYPDQYMLSNSRV
jgi:hypothetical protein